MSDVEVVEVQYADELDPAAHARLAAIDAEVEQIAHQVHELTRIKRELLDERRAILAEQRAAQRDAVEHTTDYTATFPWSTELLRRARTVFGIEAFRTGQECVCNAAMDGRDVVVVMPTGAGKSLCHQLPALLSDAVTLVISPLIALMHDQVVNLRARGVPCALLSSTTTKEEASAVLHAVRNDVDAPKLLYVTPERVAKSKTLLAALQSAYEQGRLGRLVVDEAHCCSTLGHDYRPDYNKLSICRRLFPRTPIMALTATLGRQALHDVLQILGLRPTTPPESAVARRTVYFRAPLHRANLRYAVVTRSANALAAHQAMCTYIEQYHANESGIVYCLSRKDTHTVADALRRLSDGRIRTGVYHADVDEADKQRVHADWRTGRVTVVCATIAFGMGIDKGDVRFVLHACLSKSLDGYYQETGRAGYVAHSPQPRRPRGSLRPVLPRARRRARQFPDRRRGWWAGQTYVDCLLECMPCWTTPNRPCAASSSLHSTLRSPRQRRAACVTTACTPTCGAPSTCRLPRGRW